MRGSSCHLIHLHMLFCDLRQSFSLSPLPRAPQLEKETLGALVWRSRRLSSPATAASPSRGSDKSFCKKAKFKVVSTPNTMRWQLSN